jgi:hypothetical protein
MEKRKIEIVFVRDYKSFVQVFKKKEKSDYILNVSKLIKDKFSTKFIVPNKVQSFLLNYEIKKLLDKAITLKNEKYQRVVYLNATLSKTSLLNTVDFISEEYLDFNFDFTIIDSNDLCEIEGKETSLNLILI